MRLNNGMKGIIVSEFDASTNRCGVRVSGKNAKVAEDDDDPLLGSSASTTTTGVGESGSCAADAKRCNNVNVPIAAATK